MTSYNSFEAVHILAERDKQIKRDKLKFNTEWNSIWSYLDEDDVYYSDGTLRPLHQIKRRAYYALQSYVHTLETVAIESERVAVNGTYARNTEFEAIYNLFKQALQQDEGRKLTRSQQETVILDYMAHNTNTPRIEFISNILSITKTAAEMRLRTVREKTLGLECEFDIIEIKDALESTPRYCPFCAEGGKITRLPNPKNAMCWNHHDRFVRREDFGWYPRDEYERVLFKSSATYWQQVRYKLDNAA